MKKLLLIALSCLILSTSACGQELININVKVVDDDGQPVENAKVVMGFLLSKGSNTSKGYTNDKGEVSALNMGTWGVSMNVTKEGYYRSTTKVANDSGSHVLTLRQKKNPIAMYLRGLLPLRTPFTDDTDKIKAYRTWVGYDMLIGDYTPPYGVGKIADFEFNAYYAETDFWNREYELKIRFPGTKNGLKAFAVPFPESKFKSDYFAPLATYQDQWEFYRYNIQNQPLKTNFKPDRNYYLRIRTKLDNQGNVVSAYYGKIYGEFPKIQYYINPTPNDRNIEYDLKTNLFITNKDK